MDAKIDFSSVQHWVQQNAKILDTASSAGQSDGYISAGDIAAFISSALATQPPEEVRQVAQDQTLWRDFLSTQGGPIETARDAPNIALFNVGKQQIENTVIEGASNSPPGKLAILAYSPWHAYQSMADNHAGITPDVRDAQGNRIAYDPMNRDVIEWDLKNFQNAGITTLAMDWSNNPPGTEAQLAAVDWENDASARGNSILSMERATETIAQFYAEKQAQGIPTPQLAIMIGKPGCVSAEGYQAKADQVKRLVEKYPGVFQTLPDQTGQEKPLVINYAPPRDQPVGWHDPSLNVVPMSAYNEYLGQTGMAAWEEHSPVVSTVNGQSWITLSAANRGLTGWSDPVERQTREGGETLERNAQTVLSSNADIMFIQSYYEGTQGEELDAEHTNDVIPSVENGSKDWDVVGATVKDFLS